MCKFSIRRQGYLPLLTVIALLFFLQLGNSFKTFAANRIADREAHFYTDTTGGNIIEGKIMKEGTAQPLPGAGIFINNQRIGISEEGGKFHIPILPNLIKDTMLLSIKYADFEVLRDTISGKALPLTKKYFLQSGHSKSDPVIIRAYARRHKAPIVCTISREQALTNQYDQNSKK